eukprot:TRINITY_DN3451_c0_g1_i1.p1 TRINITY_DN3451_c0_g1~~TRINITY_DN3451_c0_g1_i1.p1  ORF type:complete len:354 (-),score=47.28 TRINITY_DN3451_c0_g1_i1:32-1093(-)
MGGPTTSVTHHLHLPPRYPPMKASMMPSLLVCLLACVVFVVGAPYPITKTYGVSQLQLQQGKTYTLYQYEGTAVVTYFWLTGTWNNGAGDSASQMNFTVYVDGATRPTYQFTPNQLIGVGFNDLTAPWGSDMMGRDSSLGGIYSHMRIPFFKSIRYDVALPHDAPASSILFWQIRVTENYPIVVSGVTLPPQTRLVQYNFQSVNLTRLEFIDFVSTSNAGAIYMHFFQSESSTANFMEGCYRAYYGGSQNQSLVSTGFEDYYQSAYYFAAGPYRQPGVGATVVQMGASLTRISGYKVHDTDPFFFDKGGFRLQWRNGDTQDPNTGQKCMDSNGPAVGNPQASTITSMTWVYEW